MEKPKIVLVISDIMETINEAKNDDFKHHATLLNEIRKMHGADFMLHSLCTSETSTKLIKGFYNQINPIFNSHKIKMGRQFFIPGYLEDGLYVDSDIFNSMDRPELVINYVRYLQNDYDVVAVYYIDDSVNSKSYNGYVESELGEGIHYHFITVGKQNIHSYNYTASRKFNISGVIQGEEFILGYKTVIQANKEFWDEKKLSEEEEKRKFQESQFSDIKDSATNEDYNEWFRGMKGKLFNKTRTGIIFSKKIECLLKEADREWDYKVDSDGYSLHEILRVLDYIDLKMVMFLYCDAVEIKEFGDYEPNSYLALCGKTKQDDKTLEVKVSIENDNVNMQLDGHFINIIEFMMRKERIPLYSLVDTLLTFIDNYYGDVISGNKICLRKNTNINENLLKKLESITSNPEYDKINFSELISSHSEKIQQKVKERKAGNDIALFGFDPDDFEPIDDDQLPF